MTNLDKLTTTERQVYDILKQEPCTMLEIAVKLNKYKPTNNEALRKNARSSVSKMVVSLRSKGAFISVCKSTNKAHLGELIFPPSKLSEIKDWLGAGNIGTVPEIGKALNIRVSTVHNALTELRSKSISYKAEFINGQVEPIYSEKV